MRELTSEVFEHEPPHRLSARSVGGPFRTRITLLVYPLDGGSRSRVTMEFELEGQGLFKLLAGFVRRNSKKVIPEQLALLKQKLESG